MKFLFDQNISHRILDRLPVLFKESTSVKKEGLINEPDKSIWEFAKRKNLVIVTQDSDFNDLTALYGFPPKIIWIRSGNLKTDDIVELLIKNQKKIQDFLQDENLGCFEIIRLRKK
jgi:predicted nuclease of predicted toxin-antitoxin system